MGLKSAFIFDWGDTVMRDYPEKPGPMAKWDHVEWIPDVEDVLKAISAKHICCIASNAGQSDTQLMIDALKRVHAEKYFQYFFTSLDLGFQKPDIRFFQAITTKIQLPASACIMVGNDYEKDIVGAKNAGMHTFFFNEKKIIASFPLADFVFETMTDLQHLINKNREFPFL